MNQHHDTQTTDVAAAPAVLPQEQAPGLSRRKFLTSAGVGSLPVIMSLQSGSAWGCVDLKCTPGENSLSNSGSAVASAASVGDGKPTDYKKPDWSSLKTISDVFKVDFNSWLLVTYNTPLYTKGSWNSNTNKFDYHLIPKTPYSNWWTTVTGECYKKKGNKYKGAKRQPAVFNSVVLINTTIFSDVFGTGTSESFQYCLQATGTLEQYLVAAFIGAVWERHPEYIKRFGARQPCYPDPSELIKAYTDALTRVDDYGREGTHNLLSLLKFYTDGSF